LKVKPPFPFFLLLPLLIVESIFILYPIYYTFQLSTLRYSLLRPEEITFIGIDNFKMVLADKNFFDSLQIGLIWTFGSVIPQFLIGLGIALILNENLKGRVFFRALFISPWLFPNVAVALMWQWMFNDIYGPLNYLLTRLGIVNKPIVWLGGNLTLFSVIIVNIWRGIPFFIIMLLAGLQSIPEQIYEASKIDGATRLQTLFRITLPLLRPIIFISLLLRIIWTFNFFDLIWILTRGGPGNATTIPPILAYTMAFLKYNFGQSAAILVLMLAILVGIVTIYFKLLGEEIR